MIFEEDVTFSCEGPAMRLIGRIARPMYSGGAMEAMSPTPQPVAQEKRKGDAIGQSPAAPSAKKAKPIGNDASAAQKKAPPPPEKPSGQAKPTSTNAPQKAADKAKTVEKTKVPEKAAARADANAPEKAAKGAKATPETPLGGRRRLPSGLQYEVLRGGKGTNVATPGKKVKVQYEGRLAKTGKRFDKGVIPFRLGLGEVIRGWDEGVKGMVQGERRRLLIPAHLGYGKTGAPPDIPPNAHLVFEVELLQA